MSRTFYTIAAVFACQSIALLVCYVGVKDISVFYVSAISLMLALIALLVSLVVSLIADHKEKRTFVMLTDDGPQEIETDLKRMQEIVHKYYKLRSEDGE